MNGDKAARVLAGLAVLAVAVVAGIVSFTHIEALALENGYTIGTARLLPFSVDGLILASSLALAAGGRPWLARLGLVLGVAATIAANVVFGVHYGVTGAIVNAWPAVTFIVSSEIVVGMMRGARDLPSADEAGETVAAGAPTTPVSTPETVADAVPADVPQTGPVDVPADAIHPVPVKHTRTVASGRAPRRAPAGKAKAPQRVFAAEISRSELPSLRAIKTRMHVGTDRAREIRGQLANILQAGGTVPEAA